MKRIVFDVAWLAALVALGFVSIVVDARVGFPALLAVITGNPT